MKLSKSQRETVKSPPFIRIIRGHEVKVGDKINGREIIAIRNSDRPHPSLGSFRIATLAGAATESGRIELSIFDYHAISIDSDESDNDTTEDLRHVAATSTDRDALVHAAHELGNAAVPALMTARRLPPSPERDRIVAGLERVLAEHKRISGHLNDAQKVNS